MRAIIFSGPSLPRAAVEAVPGVEWRPPARQGDLYRAALTRPDVIGLVDGYFEVVPTVWHKEILWGMAQGIHVYGAASLGALRAAELALFGMKGVGRIFEAYRDGTLQDDDEVALQHGPEELGFVQLSEAMVNVRATIDGALRLGIVEGRVAAALTRIARSLFYKDRTYVAVLSEAARTGVATVLLRAFSAWLPQGRVDRKRLDAVTMLAAVAGHLSAERPLLRVEYSFANTATWDAALRHS